MVTARSSMVMLLMVTVTLALQQDTSAATSGADGVGGFVTITSADTPDAPVSISFSAQSRPLLGGDLFRWGDETYRGTFSCVVIDGADAWLAGPVTQGPEGHRAMFMWVHDSGDSGDTAFQKDCRPQ